MLKKKKSIGISRVFPVEIFVFVAFVVLKKTRGYLNGSWRSLK